MDDWSALPPSACDVRRDEGGSPASGDDKDDGRHSTNGSDHDEQAGSYGNIRVQMKLAESIGTSGRIAGTNERVCGTDHVLDAVDVPG